MNKNIEDPPEPQAASIIFLDIPPSTTSENLCCT